MTTKVRLAGSRGLMVPFTPRGRKNGTFLDCTTGFIRLNGKTVSGYIWSGISGDQPFYPTGIHREMAYDIAREYNNTLRRQEAA